ncbi:hypothetical protein KC367_g8187 [Hortaea werneckii]|nr:hypothetical protein KC358_g8369 [Hortaea werneckii]KAI6926040.1 hypothetical protein KC348_g8802 [Hortaea werneckii]KAI6933558.1 hypothetical protein KC341_g8221 [Hortaea werneckii]KAI6968118.1 hypothetical protein KC321_g8639 [Hortaea werneckii]KAI6983366.1 hypothetical protein KC329_g8567 [Hortaea werneckii]
MAAQSSAHISVIVFKGSPLDYPQYRHTSLWLNANWTLSQILAFLQNVRIDHFDREFNCQTWIERALKSLKDERVLSPAEYDLGINGMVDAIAEAEDEEF